MRSQESKSEPFQVFCQRRDALLAERSAESQRLTITASNIQEEAARARVAHGAEMARPKGDRQNDYLAATSE
eukprot:6645843-Alexandrium_andersonii.AAC.1